MPQHTREASFTLIELLIVIAILAILGTIAVMVINPAEMFKQSRDAARIAHLSAVNKALGIYQAEGNTSLGTSSVLYVSVPDSSATCANLGLPSLPSGWSYSCAPTSTYRNVNGSGWVPVNFTQMSIGSPLGTLPIDPHCR